VFVNDRPLDGSGLLDRSEGGGADEEHECEKTTNGQHETLL
jgi:hypothetical protein